jgi:hypothetical protein
MADVRAYRCVGGPMHGQTIHTDQYDYLAIISHVAAATFDPGDFAYPPAGTQEQVRYRIERFASRTHNMALRVMVADGVNVQSIEALRMLLDAFMPELIEASERG